MFYEKFVYLVSSEINAISTCIVLLSQCIPIKLAYLESVRKDIHSITSQFLSFMQSENLGTLVLNNSVDGIFSFDQHYNLTFWNPAMEKHSGYQQDKVIGHNLFELFPHLHTYMAKRTFSHVLQGQKEQMAISPFQNHDPESFRYSQLYLSPITDKDASVSGGMAIVRAIDPPVDAQHDSVSREQLLEGLLKNSTDIISRIDCNYRHLYINHSIESISGLPASDFIGKTSRELNMPGHLCDLWENEIDSVCQHNQTRRFEFPYPTAQGDQTYESIMAPETNANGEVVSVLSVTREITELRKAESQIMRIAHSVPGIIFTLRMKPDNQQYIEFVNKHLELLLGYDKELFKYDVNKLYALVHPDDASHMQTKVQATLQKRESFKGTYRFKTSTGKYLWLRVQGSTEELQNGDVLFYGLALDVSYEKKMEQSLRENEQMLQEQTLNLSERVKELNSLHKISSLIARRRELALSKLSRHILPYIPPGFQFPEQTEACIHLYSHKYMTDGFTEHANCQESPIYRYGQKIGKLQVALLAKSDRAGDQPAFMPEEGQLINNIASMLGKVVEQKKVERDLRVTNKKLMQLTNQMENIQEQEKQQIASVLHDEIGHELTAIKFDLSWMRDKLRERGNGEQELISKTDRLLALTNTAVETSRRIAHELRPVILDKLGLIPAMEWQVEQFLKSSGILCNFRQEVTQGNYHPDFTVALFRIFQEALQNILRHAKATSVDVTIRQTAKRLILTIYDNGIGLPSNHALADHDKLGIFSIQQRVDYWKGFLHLTSKNVEGTKMKVSFPLATICQ